MPQPLNYLHEIKQVVVVMFENRSFDNLLGWLYDQSEHGCLNFVPAAKNKPFQGLDGKELGCKFPTSFEDPKTYPVVKGTTPYDGQSAESAFTVPAPDPHEPFQYVWRQLWGPDVQPPKKGSRVDSRVGESAPMSGFLADYANAVGYTGGTSSDQLKKKAIALKILETYTPDQAPVLNTLARWYGVSDEWFCSIPSQTNCNRAFAGAGTSQGLVNNHWSILHKGAPVAWSTETIWNVLLNQGKMTNADWKIYYSELWFSWIEYCFTVDMFSKLYHAMEDSNEQRISQFHVDAAAGNLPAFSFLEPMWYLAGNSDGPPSSYHPPSDIANAEQFLKGVFESLTTTSAAKRKWRDTLLVIYFDEHGGCYDHVSPPNCVPPGDMGSPPAKPKYIFDFKTLGCRVPAILASPRIEKNTVFRSNSATSHIDHCSLIATLLKWQGIDPSTAGMGDRVTNAPTFEDVFTLSAADARTDLPDFGSVRSPAPMEGVADGPDAPHGLTDEHFSQIGQILGYITDGKVSGPRLVEEVEAIREAETNKELRDAMEDFARRYAEKGVLSG